MTTTGTVRVYPHGWHQGYIVEGVGDQRHVPFTYRADAAETAAEAEAATGAPMEVFRDDGGWSYRPAVTTEAAS